MNRYCEIYKEKSFCWSYDRLVFNCGKHASITIVATDQLSLLTRCSSALFQHEWQQIKFIEAEGELTSSYIRINDLITQLFPWHSKKQDIQQWILNNELELKIKSITKAIQLQKKCPLIPLQTLQKTLEYIYKEKESLIENFNQSGSSLLKISKKKTGSLSFYLYKNFKKKYRFVLSISNIPVGKGKFKKIYKGLSLSHQFKAIAKIDLRDEHDVAKVICEVAISQQFVKNSRVLGSAEYSIVLKENGYKQYVLMPFCEKGNLLSLIKTSLSPAQRMLVMHDILEAIAFLHAKRIAHLDIKEENFLVYFDAISKELRIKICDFGLSNDFKISGNSILPRGTTLFFSPEIARAWKNKTTLNEQEALASDVWAIGTILFRIYYGYYPTRMCGIRKEYFDSSDDLISYLEKLSTFLKSPPLKPQSPLIILIKKMLCHEYTSRISVFDALKEMQTLMDSGKT